MSTIVPFKTSRRKPKIVRIKCRKIGCRHYTRDPYAAKWVYLEDPGPLPQMAIGWWEPDCLEKLAVFWANPLPPSPPHRLRWSASFVAVDQNLKPLKR